MDVLSCAGVGGVDGGTVLTTWWICSALVGGLFYFRVDDEGGFRDGYVVEGTAVKDTAGAHSRPRLAVIFWAAADECTVVEDDIVAELALGTECAVDEYGVVLGGEVGTRSECGTFIYLLSGRDDFIV